MIAIQPKSRQILGVNQQAYQALKASMSLNLRRQLLIAVCDNVVLQNQLATQLENDLAQVSWLPPRGGSAASGGGSLALERLVFDPEDAHLPRQVAHWVRQTLLAEGTLPQVQVLGVEQMTRQPAIIQNHFLRSLEQIEALLPRLNTSLLVWVPWPWLRTIQSSSPTFWKWRNGVFEFISDPTPALPAPGTSASEISALESSASDLQPLQDRASSQASFESDSDRFSEEISYLSTGKRIPAPTHVDSVRLEGERASSASSGLEAGSGVNDGVENSAIESSSIHNSDDNYPRIDPHQVVALYGETDDSDISDYGQPTLETIATWDTVDVIATTVHTSPVPDEPTSQLVPEALPQPLPQPLPQSSAPQALPASAARVNSTPVVRKEPAVFVPLEETTLLAAATAALGAHQAALHSTANQAKAIQAKAIQAKAITERSAVVEAPPKIAPQLPPVEPANAKKATSTASEEIKSKERGADRQKQERWLAAQQQDQQRLSEQQLAAEKEAAELEHSQSEARQAEDKQAQKQIQKQQVLPSLQEAPQVQKQVEKADSKPVSLAQQAKPKPAQSSAMSQQQAQRHSAADGYFEVGHRYRQRIEAGERGLDIIEPAIAAYEGALRCLNGPHPDWGSGLNDLGTLYWLKAQQLDDQQQVTDCMNHSIDLYRQALNKIDLEQSADMACQLYSNVGAVFSMLATQKKPVVYFKKAAEAYRRALALCPISLDAQEFATLQNSLGSVYWKLSHYEQDQAQVQEYLQQAIAAYQEAARGYSPENRPLDYAAVQNNLGITYWSLAKHKDSVSALKSAIAAYRDALNYRTPDNDAAACAITYNNLALAYWDLSKDASAEAANTEDTSAEDASTEDTNAEREHKLRYQRNAVIAFEASLQTANGVGALSKEDSAAIYHCLGDVHAQMVENTRSLTEVADSLQKSLHSYVQAIDGVSMDSPIFQARMTAIVANLRSHHDKLGLANQQAALNRVPAHLVSLVMQALQSPV